MANTVEPKIYKDEHPRFLTNSPNHYGYHCGGHPYGYAFNTACEMAARYQDANKIPDATHYSVIEIAIIKYPGSEDLYYVEDRSKREKSEDGYKVPLTW